MATVGQVFVDESKAREYLLVAAVVLPGSMNTARRVVRDLTMPRQPRIHMKRESDARRRKILEAFVGLAPEVTVYRAGSAYRTELERRERCLRALVEDIARDRRTHLCLERDESLVQRDRRHLIEATRAAGCSESLAYRHESATAEPLLALPDAIAWAWARGTSWRQRCEPVVSRVVDL